MFSKKVRHKIFEVISVGKHSRKMELAGHYSVFLDVVGLFKALTQQGMSKTYCQSDRLSCAMTVQIL